MIRRLLPFALAAAAAAGCAVHDPWGEPLPGHEAIVVLRPGAPPVPVAWPVNFRRGAICVFENRTGRDIETLLFDLGNPGSVLVEAGGTLRVRVNVAGDPGAGVAVITVPGVTPP